MLGAVRVERAGRLRRGLPVMMVAVVLVPAIVAGGAGSAAAAGHRGAAGRRGDRAALTAGDIYNVAGDGTAGFAGNGGGALKAELHYPYAVAVDRLGNVVISDLLNYRVRVVAENTGTFYGRAMTAGRIYTVAGDGSGKFFGDGGPATMAGLEPWGVTVDGAGNLVIGDFHHNRVRVVAESTGTFYGQPMTAGDIYTVAGNGRPGFSGDGGPATAANLDWPSGVAVDKAGNLVIAAYGNNRVRVVAESTGTFYEQPMTAGDIYTIVDSNGDPGDTGDGGPATAATLYDPEAVSVDSAGNVLICDVGNSKVRVVAASTGTFYGQPMTAGDIYAAAGTGGAGFSGDGGPAINARLYQPGAVATDTAGNLLIADSGNNRVRVVAASTGTFYGQAMTAGDIYTVAGTGSAGFSGDGGPGVDARLRGLEGVAGDGAGDVVIADTGNNRVRKVAG
jgi:hypothetical protein